MCVVRRTCCPASGCMCVVRRTSCPAPSFPLYACKPMLTGGSAASPAHGVQSASKHHGLCNCCVRVTVNSGAVSASRGLVRLLAPNSDHPCGVLHSHWLVLHYRCSIDSTLCSFARDLGCDSEQRWRLSPVVYCRVSRKLLYSGSLCSPSLPFRKL